MQRLHLAMAGSVSFALASVFAGSAPTIGGLFGLARAEVQLQAGIAVVCALSALCMFAPVAVIDERRHCDEPTVRNCNPLCGGSVHYCAERCHAHVHGCHALSSKHTNTHSHPHTRKHAHSDTQILTSSLHTHHSCRPHL